MTINEIAAAMAIALPFLAGLAWLIRLESKIKENELKNTIELENQAQDIRRVEADLKELIKSSIRSDERMADALNKLSLNMERTMERIEHMNRQLVNLELKQENNNK